MILPRSGFFFWGGGGANLPEYCLGKCGGLDFEEYVWGIQFTFVLKATR